jgi:hypothetical protein
MTALYIVSSRSPRTNRQALVYCEVHDVNEIRCSTRRIARSDLATGGSIRARTTQQTSHHRLDDRIRRRCGVGPLRPRAYVPARSRARFCQGQVILHTDLALRRRVSEARMLHVVVECDDDARAACVPRVRRVSIWRRHEHGLGASVLRTHARRGPTSAARSWTMRGSRGLRRVLALQARRGRTSARKGRPFAQEAAVPRRTQERVRALAPALFDMIE